MRMHRRPKQPVGGNVAVAQRAEPSRSRPPNPSRALRPAEGEVVDHREVQVYSWAPGKYRPARVLLPCEAEGERKWTPARKRSVAALEEKKVPSRAEGHGEEAYQPMELKMMKRGLEPSQSTTRRERSP
jgi:hypothetical protein